MVDLLRKARPTQFEDLAALNALYRPGALDAGMVDEYVKRKNGTQKPKYLVPAMKEILEETYGVIVYQEQVMQIAQQVAGYSLGQADLLRKAMGKKDAEVMAAERGEVRRRRGRQRLRQEEGERDLRLHRAVRALRLQQVALGGVRARRVSDGVAEGALPAALHGRADVVGNGPHRGGGEVHRRGEVDGHRGAAARRERVEHVLHRRRHRTSASASAR